MASEVVAVKTPFVLTVFVLLCVSGGYGATLMSGDFMGSVTWSRSGNATGLIWGDPITGTVVFDDEQRAANSAGLVNVPLAELVIRIGSAPEYLFHKADDISGTMGWPMIQFRNGAFNGVVFLGQISPAGPIIVNAQGRTLSIYDNTNPFRRVSLVNGSISTNLTNVHPYAPAPTATPEPGTVGLAAAGLAGALLLRKQTPR